MEKRRVVITGMGAVTPIGNNVETFWKNVKEGKNGIGSITKFDTTDYKVKIAAEVKDFSAKELMDFKAAKRMETFSQYAVAAAKEACADAGFNIEEEDPYRCGVIIGSGVGSLQQVEFFVFIYHLFSQPVRVQWLTTQAKYCLCVYVTAFRDRTTCRISLSNEYARFGLLVFSLAVVEVVAAIAQFTVV